MNFVDRVKDTTTTTGTGSITLSGTAPTGFMSFSSGYGTAAQDIPYCITDGTSWEVGYGTLSSSTTLARSQIIASSNSNAAVSWSAGTKDVFVTVPANWMNKSKSIGQITMYRLGAYWG